MTPRNNTYIDKATSAAQGALRGYKSFTDKAPWAESLVLGSLGAVGAHYASKKMTDGLIRTLLIKVPPEKRAEALRKLEEDGTVGKITRASTALGAVLGATYPALKHGDFSHGPARAAQSLLDPKYKEKYKHVFDLKRRDNRIRDILSPPYFEHSRSFTSGR